MTKEENEKRLAYLKNIVSNLPNKPGTYQYYDKEHTIIYVGKAKNLKIEYRLTFIKKLTVSKQKYWFRKYTILLTPL